MITRHETIRRKLQRQIKEGRNQQSIRNIKEFHETNRRTAIEAACEAAAAGLWDGDLTKPWSWPRRAL